MARENLVRGLRRVGQKANIRMTLGVERVVHNVRTVGEGHEHVHGLSCVFGGADQKTSTAGEIQNCFVLASDSATSHQIAELVVVGGGILWRGFLPQGGLDKNNRAIPGCVC